MLSCEFEKLQNTSLISALQRSKPYKLQVNRRQWDMDWKYSDALNTWQDVSRTSLLACFPLQLTPAYCNILIVFTCELQLFDSETPLNNKYVL